MDARFTSAWGPNKKMAEQKAALLALEELGVFSEGEIDQSIGEIAEQTDQSGDADEKVMSN